MICVTDCTEVKCLIQPGNCTESSLLYLGDVTPGTDYTVYIYNETTNKTEAVDYTSSVYGSLDIDLVDYGLIFNPHGVYYIWATLQGGNMTDKEDLTIDAVVYTCYIATFERVFIGGIIECPTAQSIEI